jgi:ATP-dependent Clp protease ATP-binding subunit ClpE
LKPEFLNRFDSVVEFSALSKDQIARIVELMLDELKETMNTQGVTLQWSEEVVHAVGRIGYHPQFGARPLRRVLQDQVEDAIADVLLEQENAKELCVIVDSSGAIAVEMKQAIAAEVN